MTGDELRHLRESRKLTRKQCALELGDCSASGLVKWERGATPVPQWVAEKMLRRVKLDLPLEELHHLLAHSLTHGLSFPVILTEAIRAYLRRR